MLTKKETKDKISTDYLGRFGIHAVGEKFHCIVVYYEPCSEYDPKIHSLVSQTEAFMQIATLAGAYGIAFEKSPRATW